MSITIDHSELKDRIDDGKLILYFPHDIEIHTRPKNFQLIQWLNYWGFRVKKKKKETIILYPNSFNLKNCFYKRVEFSSLQSFNKDIKEALSGNDFLNLIFSKALISMGVAKKTCSIIKNTSNQEFLKRKTTSYNSFCKHIKYSIDNKLYEKDLKLDNKIVNVLKKDGKENLYNDFCVMESSGNRVLFLKSDFDAKDLSYIQDYYSNNKNLQFLNIGNLNCVGLNKDKVLYADIISRLNSTFSITEISHNVLVGLIFSKDIGEDVEVDFTKEEFIKSSPGYYMSKTYIDLKSNGIIFEKTIEFNSNVLQYYFIKSLWYCNPCILFNALILHCDKINEIFNNEEFDLLKDDNVKTFLSGLLEDLELGMKRLGMFLPERIYD